MTRYIIVVEDNCNLEAKQTIWRFFAQLSGNEYGRIAFLFALMKIMAHI